MLKLSAIYDDLNETLSDLKTNLLLAVESAIEKVINEAEEDFRYAFNELKKVIYTEEELKEKEGKSPLHPPKEEIRKTTTTRAGAGECAGERTHARTTFTPPSQEEVLTYLRERKSPIDGIKFWHYYDSNGWKVGRNKMKNWKSAVVTWERKERERKIEKWRNSKTVLRPTDEQLNEAKGVL